MMRRYLCHKVVEAGVIADHQRAEDELQVVLDDGELVAVPESFFARGDPGAGDYLVRYEDGYLSWSPKAAFEAGYNELEEEGS